MNSSAVATSPSMMKVRNLLRDNDQLISKEPQKDAKYEREAKIAIKSTQEKRDNTPKMPAKRVKHYCHCEQRFTIEVIKNAANEIK